MAEGGRMAGAIYGSAAVDAVIGSSDVAIYADEGTKFSAEICQSGVLPDRELTEGTIDIKDTGINTLVVESSDINIDNRGLKTEMKISRTDEDIEVGGMEHPESDAPASMGHGTRVVSNGVVINSVVNSSDTKISMEGAKVNIRTKKKKHHKRPKPGQINLSNSAAVNVVAYSQKTDVDMTGAEIKIE